MIISALSALLPTTRGNFRNLSLENPTVSLQDPEAWDDLFGVGSTSDSGIRVGHESSLELAPVWNAVSLISGDVAILPLNVFERSANGDREIDTAHPAQFLISERPNPETSAFEFWRRFMVHALLWQNAYAFISRPSRVGEPVELINLLPDRTTGLYNADGKLFYVTDVGGRLEPLLREQILHVKGLSIANTKGMDLVDKARNSWGLALAAEGFSSKFFAHGAQTGGILEVPLGASEKYDDNLVAGFQKKYSGKDNWFKVMALRDGAKFHSTTIDPKNSQTHELREDQVRDAARFFNLPPFKLGIADSVSYNSIEQAQLVYLTSGLMHWLGAIKAEVELKLLTEQQVRRRTHFVEHNVSKIIEIDVQTQNKVLEIQLRNEVISPNEWRRKINLNRRSDGGGDKYRNPNTRSSDSDSKRDVDSVQARAAYCELLADAINRVARRVTFDARKRSKKSDRLLEWIDTSAQEHRGVFGESLRPVLNVIAAWCGIDVESILAMLEGRFFSDITTSIDELTKAPYKTSALVESVDSVCTTFENNIAERLVPLVIMEA